MSGKKLLIPLLAALFFTFPVYAGNNDSDSINDIARTIRQADAESLSLWFADILELTLDGRTGVATNVQAFQILKWYFEANTPQSFNIIHIVDNGSTKYALGDLHAGGSDFDVLIFVEFQKDGFYIRQLKIDKTLTPSDRMNDL